MGFYNYFPPASDRMGALWTLSGIKNAVIIEFGPSGNISFENEGFFHLNTRATARIFCTHISESDITFGSVDRLVGAIKEVDALYQPDIIFILASSLAAVIGIDTIGVCHEIQQGINARLLAIDNGGYRGDYTHGIRNTMALLCSEVVENKTCKGTASYNILGSQADCYNFRADVKEIKNVLKKYFHLTCAGVFTDGSSVHEIKNASKALFNVVMRSEALDGAKILKEKFDQDFILGTAYGKQSTLEFLKNVSQLTEIDINKGKLKSDIHDCDRALAFVRTLGEQCEHKVLISGNRDAVMGMGGVIKEMGFERAAGIINHEVKGVYSEVPDTHEQVKINPSEEEEEAFLKAWEPDIVLGDGVLTDMLKYSPDIFCHQVSNPNINKISLFDGAPYIGFNGVVHLCEVLCNGLISKRGARFPMGHGKKLN